MSHSMVIEVICGREHGVDLVGKKKGNKDKAKQKLVK